MAKTKSPAKALTRWPPAGFAKAHKIQSGENWWTLAERYGRKDVWDIIRYNFETKDPEEINWYLYNLVGCRTTTTDSKNYRFSSTDQPGFIYIPAGSWSPGALVDSDDLPGAKPSEAARQAVLSVLGDGRLSVIDFHIDVGNTGMILSRSEVAKIRRLILSREVTVYYDRYLSAPSKYNAFKNRLTLSFENASTPGKRCWILCGALYATFDLQKLGVAWASELAFAAILGMALYARRICGSVEQLTSELPTKDRILRLAWRLAEAVIKTGDIDHDAWEQLEILLQMDPALAGSRVTLDGI